MKTTPKQTTFLDKIIFPAGKIESGVLHRYLSQPFSKLSVIAEKGSTGFFVIHATSSSEINSLKAVIEVRVAENAKLKIAFLQNASHGSSDESQWHAEVEKGASFEYIEITLGEGHIQNTLDIRLAGVGASASLNGLSVLSGGAKNLNQTLVTHASPETTSRQLYKDILSDSARSEYSGVVHVTRKAVKSDSNQQCRNLLLSDSARAYSRPQLKIDTDDVKCSHGSATGQLPASELFYLRSRGLSMDEARAILIAAFAEEVILTLPDEALRQEVHVLVRRELERVAGLLPEEVSV